MRKSSLAMLALAAGFCLTGVTAQQAAAAPVAKHGFTAGSDIVQVRLDRHRGVNRGFYKQRHVRSHRLWQAPLFVQRADRGGCYWLKRKAINTGSRYWQRRYNACRFG